MTCGCGRSPDGCRGWHSLSEEEYQIEYQKFLQEQEGQVSVIEVEHYTDSLFRFTVEKPNGYDFRAGEFTMISLDDSPKRAYSITSGPEEDFLEFYSIKVPDGPLTSRLKNIQVGDKIKVGDKPTGTLVVDNLTSGSDLWLLATGTGIAPFVSLLRDPKTREQFENIHIVWSVRTAEELASYQDFFAKEDCDFIPIVTRDTAWTGEKERITDLLREGMILNNADPDSDKVMLCGNYDFNVEIKSWLEAHGWQEGTKKSSGSFVVEKAFIG